MAIVEAVTVVHRNSRMPKAGCSPPGAHTRLVKKFAELSISAGTACTMRKMAIRVTRTMTKTPETVAAPPKSRSPTRPVDAWSPCRGLRPSGPGVWSAPDTPVTVDTWSPLPSLCFLLAQGRTPVRRPPLRGRPCRIAPAGSGGSGDRVDRGLDLGRHLGRQRRVALGLEALLDLVRGEGLEEALDLLARLGVGVLRADDLVGDEDDRVGPGLLGGVVDLEREVVAHARLLGRGDRLAGRLGGQLDGTGTRVDLGHGELVLLGVGELDVGDAAVLALRRGGDAGRLLLALALAGPLLAGLVGPGVGSGGLEALREVLGRARLVGAEEDLDRRRGKRDALVERGDGRVVPGRDLAVEDLRGHPGVEHELVDALDVVGDRDGAGDHGQVPGLGAAGRLGVVGLDLAVLGLGLERRVGPGEVDLLGDELLDAGTGAGGLVVDVGVGAGRLVRLEVLVAGVLLGRGSLGLEVAAEAVAGGGRASSGRAGTGSGAVVLGRAGRERKSAGQGDGAESADTRNRHECDPSRWGVPGWSSGQIRATVLDGDPPRT